MAKAKEYRRFIRVQGKVISSPRFTKKRDADEWFDLMKRQKNFGKHGFKVSGPSELTFLDYVKTWLEKRAKARPQATWQSDEQRLRKYVMPEIGGFPFAAIVSQTIREVLIKVTESGQSIETRTRVKAVISKIFSDAFNEGIIKVNPVYGIKFDDKRKGKKKPEFLQTDVASAFLEAAKSLTPEHEFIALCGLFLGLRKSEIIPLASADFDFKARMVTIRRKFEQASNQVLSGTKSGEDVQRQVPIPMGVVTDLKRCIELLKSDNPYLLKGRARPYLPPRIFHERFLAIADKAMVRTSSHKLRHTFGREFVRNGGSLKALQAILGHSVSTTTDRYSNLDGQDVAGQSDVVSYGVKSEVES